MSDTPTPSGSTPSPNQSEIDAALAAAGAPPESNAPPAPADAVALTSPAIDASTVIAEAASAVGGGAGVGAAHADAVLADAAHAIGVSGDVAKPPMGATPVSESGVAEYDDTAAAIAAALAEEQAQAAAVMGPPPGSMPLDLPDFGRRAVAGDETRGVDLLNDVDLNVKIELGRAEMSIDEVLRLGAGAVVELDKLAGDPVDVLVNDRLVARGEVLILNDNFCVRISEILAGEEAEATP